MFSCSMLVGDSITFYLSDFSFILFAILVVLFAF